MDNEVGMGTAARILGISASTLKRLCDESLIPSKRTPGGHRRFELATVELINHRLGRHSHKPSTVTSNDLQERMVRLHLTGDADALEESIRLRRRHGHSLPAVIDDLVAPALARIVKDAKNSAATKILALNRASRVLSKVSQSPDWKHSGPPTCIGWALAEAHDNTPSKLVEAALRSLQVAALHCDAGIELAELTHAAKQLNLKCVWIAGWYGTSLLSMRTLAAKLRQQLPSHVRVLAYTCGALTTEKEADSNSDISRSLQVLCKRALQVP